MRIPVATALVVAAVVATALVAGEESRIELRARHAVEAWYKGVERVSQDAVQELKGMGGGG